MTLESLLLSSVPGIRHAFFTRAGGVSSGIYAGLNGGLGSKDEPENVQENRRRMAAALDVPPEKLLTLHQIHSPDVIVATEPWPTTARPKGDAMVTKVPGHRARRHRGRLRAGADGRSEGARDRRGACGLEGRARRRARGDDRCDGGAGRLARRHHRRSRADAAPAQLRGRHGVRRPLRGGGSRTTRASSRRPRGTATRCSICRAISMRGCRRRAC